MANEIKYVSLSNLEYYDGKIKEHIADADAALKENLEGQVEVVAGALDSEITRAKAAEATNAAAAEAAQTDVDNLAAKVGEVEDGKTVMGIIAQIQEDAYDDTEIRGLISDLDEEKADKTQVTTDIAAAVKVETDARVEAVSGVQSEVDTLEQTVANNKAAIEGTVSTLEEKVDANEEDIENKMTALTSRVAANETAVQTTLPNAISAEQARAEEAESELSASIAAVKEDVDAFFADADMTESAKDTLKELQEYISSDETGAAAMAASIKQNSDDIDALETAVAKKAEQTALDSEASTRESADNALDTRLKAVETAVGDGGAVAEDIAEAKQEAVDTAAQDATTKANTAEANAKTYADGLNTAMDERVDALETDTHTHGNKALLDTYTQTEADLADAVAKKHEHSNFDVLESITSAKVTTWDTVTSKATQTDLTAEVNRATAKEDELQAAIDSFTECTESDINNLFV